MTNTKDVADLALLLTSAASALTPDERDRARDMLADRLDDLSSDGRLWTFQARDAAVAVVREIDEERARRRMAIPRLAADRAVPNELGRGLVAAFVWTLSCLWSDDEKVRAVVAEHLRCDPSTIVVRARRLNTERNVEFCQDTAIHFVASPPPRASYRVTWGSGESSECVLEDVVLTETP